MEEFKSWRDILDWSIRGGYHKMAKRMELIIDAGIALESLAALRLLYAML